MKKVLCVCTGSGCCLPRMAEILQRKLGSNFLVEMAISCPCGNSSVQDRIRLLSIPEENAWMGGIGMLRYAHIVCANEEAAQNVCDLLACGDTIPIVIANGDNPCTNGTPAYHRCMAFVNDVIPGIVDQIQQSITQD